MDFVFTMFPPIQQRLSRIAGTLSGGEQQMLAVARALMTNPSLLMLDEPSMGLAPMVVRDIFQTLSRLKDGGMTILLVEQNARLALTICDFSYILDTGKVTRSGPGKELLEDRSVIDAYLGGV
jgi:branched-chain amino acid transport system ATP-binding protein